MKVAVLGCGPAGLLAVHAATINKHTAVIYAPKSPSTIGGAQYIHEAIPGATPDKQEGSIWYAKIGSADGYAQKVYGDESAPTSWTAFDVGEVPAWSMQKTYDRLWAKYAGRIEDATIDPWDIDDLCVQYDLVLSSAPVHRLCKTPLNHDFVSQRVCLIPDSPLALPNAVVYSGRSLDPWYRTSNIFGFQWTEFSEASHQAPREFCRDSVNGIKPISTNCDCHTEHVNFRRIGRFGQFKKGVLVHDAFNDALEACERTVRESVV